MDDKGLVLFEGEEVRRTYNNGEWWFVVEDVVRAVSESSDAKQYIKRMRKRDEGLADSWDSIVERLPIETTGGAQNISCANMEGCFRIIQSISSPRAEPFKLWLSQVGYERVQEIENPELTFERVREDFRLQGYTDEWIDIRLQSISIRDQLTDTWKERGVDKGMEYAILTAEISRGTFGLSPSEYKQLKGLKRENLRNHMENTELIFTMLGEEQTRQEAIKRDAQGFLENKEAAIEGGLAAGAALDAFEKRTGQNIVTDQNFKAQIKAAKAQKRLEDKKKK
jgi:hypothetical protein